MDEIRKSLGENSKFWKDSVFLHKYLISSYIRETKAENCVVMYSLQGKIMTLIHRPTFKEKAFGSPSKDWRICIYRYFKVR